MDVDPPTPTSPLRRKRTFHDLSEATSSLALQTPNPQDVDPHYNTDYFSTSTSTSAPAPGPNPFALPGLTSAPVTGVQGTAATRNERSISPSKRLRVQAHRSVANVGVGEAPLTPSPLASGQGGGGGGGGGKGLGFVGADGGVDGMDVAMDSGESVNREVAVGNAAAPAAVPGKMIPLEQCNAAFDTVALLRGLVTDGGGRGPTANWGMFGPESTVLVYVTPTWREDFGRGSGGYVSHLEGVGGLGMAFEGCCVAIHNTMTAISPTAQALAVSDRLDLPLHTNAPANHIQELTSVLPVRRAPEASLYLQQAAAHLLGVDLSTSPFSDGLLVLIDHQGNIRLVLPLSELRNVAVNASTSGSISVARRKAISSALEGVLKDAFVYLEEEKAWLKGQR
ncbi:E3 ubiquitin-protein ligase UHRF1 [Elsinoe australis]|uniref:E3 ubiquitin-protein ligase UHRF1 n=1 Tax=Elsinoe australis TaxID=40998 RepID=A0A2P8A496_9PEZI|nr:E3 ubiquitin-protein ligase UHRF1 [Elsinoe australis]